MKLTIKEKNVILAIVEHGKSNNSDNPSWFSATDLIEGKFTDLSMDQLSGIMSALYKKGIIHHGKWLLDKEYMDFEKDGE